MFLELKTILVSSIVFISIDFIYLNLITSFFKKQVQDIQHSPMKLNYIGAIVSYFFLILAINYFILSRQNNMSITDAFIFGLCIYGVYEGTNYALFTNWYPTTVIIDTIWGGILFALTTYITRKFI